MNYQKNINKKDKLINELKQINFKKYLDKFIEYEQNIVKQKSELELKKHIEKQKNLWVISYINLLSEEKAEEIKICNISSKEFYNDVKLFLDNIKNINLDNIFKGKDLNVLKNLKLKLLKYYKSNIDNKTNVIINKHYEKQDITNIITTLSHSKHYDKAGNVLTIIVNFILLKETLIKILSLNTLEDIELWLAVYY